MVEKRPDERDTGNRPGVNALKMLHSGFSFIGVDAVKRLMLPKNSYQYADEHPHRYQTFVIFLIRMKRKIKKYL